jgi:hypothetical protein
MKSKKSKRVKKPAAKPSAARPARKPLRRNPASAPGVKRVPTMYQLAWLHSITYIPRGGKLTKILKRGNTHILCANVQNTQLYILDVKDAELKPVAKPPKTKAARAYAAFHWGDVVDEKINAMIEFPESMYVKGVIQAIEYRTHKGGKKSEIFVHDFGTPRPLLCNKGAALYIVGGRYRIKEEGIVG